MDNLTHALVGLVLADAVATALPKAPSARARGWLRLGSAVGNNLPDLDFSYASITEGKLGYLLHHRGHTHTLLVGTVLGALVLSLLLAVARRRGLALSLAEKACLAGLTVFGPWAHVGMDALNNYGVHPFWPVHDGWFYGDAVFIVEPWFWVFAVPPLVLASTTRWGRALLALCLAVGLILAWIMPPVSWPAALSLTLGSATCAITSGRLHERGRAWLGAGGCIAVMLAFLTASRAARAELVDAVARDEASAQVTVVDAILTPAPANPLCWQGIVVSRRNDEYVLDVAFVSAAPGVTPAATCRLETTGASLGMGPPSPRSTPAVHFEGQHRAPLAELRHFARSNCHVAAFLRFARAPFWRERGESVLVGDLRYDRSASEGFAELEVPLRPANCPAWLPPWTPPRRALLETP